MADDNKENLSTEQILSSIRTILSDEEKVLDDEAKAPRDDVFELTSAMMINRNIIKTPVAEDEKIESESAEPKDVVPEPELPTEHIAEAKSSELLEIESDPEPLLLTRPIVKLKETSNMTTQVNINSEAIALNIIKTFSNMFSNIDFKNVDSSDEFLDKTHPVDGIDSYSEDTLKSLIFKSVEDWLFKNMNSDLELQAIVREEVARQVKIWLDANLTGLIASSITLELERVMAKDDSSQ